jgi:hypothetical protein
MTKAKQLPYINRFTGAIKIMTKRRGDMLSEDWERPKIVRNSEGKKVFRFKLSAPVKAPDGNMIMGTATIDVAEQETEAEILDVQPSST